AKQAGWSHEPVEPVVKNDKIYGRAATDMKGSNACEIFSMKEHDETGAKFRGRITPTFTTDEEVGGYSVVNYLVDKHVITKDVDYCLSADSGIEALHIASLGHAEYLITVHGSAAH